MFKFHTTQNFRTIKILQSFSFFAALFEGCSLEVSKTGITCIEDEAFSCIPAGSRFVDLILNTFQDAPYTLTDLITAHNAGCKVIIKVNHDWLIVSWMILLIASADLANHIICS